MIAFPPSTAAVVSFNTFVDNVLTDFDSAPTIILDRNESASGVTVTVTNEGSGWYKAAFTTGAWTSGDRLRLRVSVGALNSVSQVGAVVWEGVIDELVGSRLAPSTSGRTIAVDASGKVTVGTNDDKAGYSLSEDQSGVTIGTVNAMAGAIQTLDALDDAQDAQHSTTQSAVSGVDTKINTLLSRITGTLFDGITSLASWLSALAGKTADTATRAEINATTAGATYNETTDSLEAVRDRGDSVWITATGFSTHSPSDVRSEIDSNSTQLAAILLDTGTTIPETLATIANYIDTEILAIKAKTDNLPADPATESTLAELDNLIDAIKAVADKVDTGLEDDGEGGYQWKTLALENGPSGSGLDADGVRAAVGLESANLDAQLGSIVEDTNEIQTDLTDGGRLDLILDGILEDTGTTLPAAISGISGGSGGSISITPIIGIPVERTEDANITLYLSEVASISVTIVDADADAVSLLGKTLQIVIEDIDSATDLQVIESANITVSGDDSNTITFVNAAAVTSTTGVRKWTLWDLTNDPTLKEVITKGKIWVREVAVED